MRKQKFSQTPLAKGIALALSATVLSPVLAQEEVIEEIVTTGIRSSLVQSMDRKRNAKGVVDAITAEDIGKFPDQNLAEALQRITGVSIDRSNNEGSQITVRGMGPEFNLVTLNGRSMPTAGDRSFDFGDISTEGVSAVEVYKTAKADLPTGGIGATINILTARPLQDPGFKSLVSVKAVHETSASSSSIVSLDDFTPEVAAMFSNTFADDRFGILISGSYQDRNNREENAAVDNWGPNLQLNGGIVNDNNQRADGVWWHPQNAGFGWAEITRERVNGQLVLQYAPSDRLTATLDYTYSEVEFEKDANSTGIWFECPNIEATINERGTVTQVSQACGDYATNISRDHTIKENDSVGLNLEWQATDSVALTLDAHTSTSALKGGGIGSEPGSSTNLFVGNTSCDWCGFVPGAGDFTATIAEQEAFYTGGGIPTFDVSFRSNGPTGGPQAELLATDLGSLFAQAFNTDVDNDIDQIQLGGSWENMGNGGIRRINFGISHTDQKFNTRNAYSGQLPAGFWLTSAQYFDASDLQSGSISGLLSGFSNGSSFSQEQYWTADFDYLVDQYETIGVGDALGSLYWYDAAFWGPDFQDPSGTRGRLWSGPLGNSGEAIIDESIDSFYTQFVFEDEFNNMPFNAVLGVRYEESETKSYGREVPATAVVWISGSEFSYEFAAESSLRQGNGKNEYWLPSVDMDLEVVDNVVARFSYSRSLARPPIGDLSPTRNFVGNPNVRQRFVTAGNPDLLPYISDNFDLSLEYYYGEGSYAAVNYFRKRVDNFLVSTTVQDTFAGLTDPYIGANAEQARADLVTAGINPDDQAVFERININLGLPITTAVRAEPGDPLAVFDITTTDNAEVGTLFGWELAVQHMFADTGFGVQANYTIVNGDVDADRDVINEQFALPGMSDSANLTVFYENDIFSARLAYNWRDEFLSGFDQYGAPVFTEEYAPLDLNVTWFATDNMAVFFEAINITEEVQRIYVRYPEQFLRGNEYGARFNIGARYNFD